MELIQGDCLEVMKNIPSASVDMILCDLPYGTTRNKWDTCLNLGKLWEQYKRIIKDNGVVCLFSQMPFSATLVTSNPEMFRYEWIVEKDNATGFLNANRMPMKAHENILVFYKKLPTYNPQMGRGKPYVRGKNRDTSSYGSFSSPEKVNAEGTRYPRDVIYARWGSFIKTLHPTQKPVPLLEYLIKTYTNEGDTVLDNCMGSGSTGVACVNTKRDFIGVELDENYFDIARRRINDTTGI